MFAVCVVDRLDLPCFHVFFFNDTATTEIYTLSLHDALPISDACAVRARAVCAALGAGSRDRWWLPLYEAPGNAERRRRGGTRSEEHTSELQSRQYLVCRLLLEKKKSSPTNITSALICSTY